MVGRGKRQFSVAVGTVSKIVPRRPAFAHAGQWQCLRVLYRRSLSKVWRLFVRWAHSLDSCNYKRGSQHVPSIRGRKPFLRRGNLGVDYYNEPLVVLRN